MLENDGWFLVATRGSHRQGTTLMRYAVVIERAESNFSAYVPDLPGCVATGATREEVEREIREAVAFHLDGLREDGLPIPAPMTSLTYVEAQQRDAPIEAPR